jgi:two-component system, sensor histidine kinase
MSPPDSAITPYSLADALEIEQTRGAFHLMPAALAGNLAGLCVILILFGPVAPFGTIATWFLAFTAMWFGRLVLTWRFRRTKPQNIHQWRFWHRLWLFGNLSAATLWGIAAWLFFDVGSGIQQTGLVITIYSFCIAAVPVLATQPRVFITFALLCFAPMIVRVAYVGDAYHLQLAGILSLIFSVTIPLARNYGQTLRRAIHLKLRADELTEQLRLEKIAADEARTAAEIANRAKTKFFTAASHDLRQPLHALGLFAEALRQKTTSTEVAPLVNSINASVDALEGLFSELLDINRIDCGAQEVTPRAFEIRTLFRKLRLHFEPTAFDKGLSLRFTGERHVVHADPVLIERILRNLMSNAIRYTNDGGVLVACRKRSNHCLLQVWDSGVGIRESEQAKIFEEFYQAPNTARITPEQRRGLGLGLAIVKRLADLMQAPLQLQSRPGHGTVFTLELPKGQLQPADAAEPASKLQGATIHLQGRFIVVVEDDPTVRAGLEALLQGWNAKIASFESVQDCQTWLKQASASQQRPDLIMADYRLENGCTGLDAIYAIREHFKNKPIPAIVVTGSTTANHEQTALEHDFHVLLKPVAPNKLRTMVAFKLGGMNASTASK